MARCEVCGQKAEVHHVVNKSQGGIDLPLNYKYLCSEHHRGKHGPHKDWKVDMQYKLELQEKLEKILYKDFYSLEELEEILQVNKSKIKRLVKNNRIYKEGYKREDIIFLLMGNKKYNYTMLESYDDFIPLLV